MNIKKILAIGALCTLAASGLVWGYSAPRESMSERMALSEMARFAEPWMIERATKPRWGYTHGLVVKAMLEQWHHTDQRRYYDYAKIYADSLINPDGSIKTMSMASYNIDNINPGKILFDIYEQSGELRYKAAMDTLVKQMESHPRTAEGGFWHKLKYEHQMWLDGIFMASPYLAEYGVRYGDTTLIGEAVNQITLIAEKTYDPKTGLYYHGWDESRTQAWANPVTGCSPNFWSRSIGWYCAALVDVLEVLPENFSGRADVMALVEPLATTLIRYQDPKSGVWFQVTDQGDREGNYLESSASSMFVYFLSRAINKGYIDSRYRSATDKAWQGVNREFIREEPNGTVTITNCCAVAGLGGDKVYRDGSFEYYVGEPVIDNDPKSVGAYLLAAIEYEKMDKKR